jgi:hypothetical protein
MLGGGNVYRFSKYRKPVQEWVAQDIQRWDWYKIFNEEWRELEDLLIWANAKKEIIDARRVLLWEHFRGRVLAHNGTARFIYECPVALRTVHDADKRGHIVVNNPLAR